jgi:hypothetical protein
MGYFESLSFSNLVDCCLTQKPNSGKLFNSRFYLIAETNREV